MGLEAIARSMLGGLSPLKVINNQQGTPLKENYVKLSQLGFFCAVVERGNHRSRGRTVALRAVEHTTACANSKDNSA